MGIQHAQFDSPETCWWVDFNSDFNWLVCVGQHPGSRSGPSREMTQSSRAGHTAVRTAETSERPEVRVVKVFRAVPALVPTVDQWRKWVHPYLDLLNFRSLGE